MRKTALLFAALAMAAGGIRAGGLPPLDAVDLRGNPVDASARLSGTASVGVLGFTRASQEQCRVWTETLHKRFALDGPRTYALVMLEGAPGFVVPTIMKSLRAQTPEAARRDVWIARKGRAPWAAFGGFDPKSPPKDAYLVLADGNASVVWRAHGECTPERLEELVSKWEGLCGPPSVGGGVLGTTSTAGSATPASPTPGL
jgi:hypothetical protein